MNPWWIYLVSSASLLVLLILLARKVLSEKWIMYFGLVLLVILFIPAAVPGTTALAPAWFIILFESIFGESGNVVQAAKPLVLVLLLFHAGLLASYFVTRRIAHP